MKEIAEAPAAVDVSEGEYIRLLGYPRGYELEGRSRELAEWAREWYALHGQPWIYAREAGAVEIGESAVRIEGVDFHSRRLWNAMRKAEAHGAFLAAAGAGREAEEEANRLWREEKPDEYFFLEVYGSAVAEHLLTAAGARLCAWAEGRGLAVLPHASPGFAQWDISEQPALLRLAQASGHDLPARLRALDSGALLPKKSLLGVFGLTRHAERVRRLTDLNPCQNCAMPGCAFRRAPYVKDSWSRSPEARWQGQQQ
ncbi:MAG TPA: hypothetical protein VMU19_10570 [Bryobacteraceae bacterium]|nr:hypothetical protein [Bryobacteraceae bacterium]